MVRTPPGSRSERTSHSWGWTKDSRATFPGPQAGYAESQLLYASTIEDEDGRCFR